MRITLDCVSVSEDGDGFQLSFRPERDDDEAYVIIQRHFEEPDDGRCYIETHDKTYVGHFRIISATLRRNRVELELQRRTSTRYLL